MNARPTPPEGWVTVAAAAAALTRAGDQIDASNVSRYLARFPAVPQEKIGKFRWVDLAALEKHRAENVLVHDKRGARGIEAPAARTGFAAPQLPLVAGQAEDDEDLALPIGKGSRIAEYNERLKALQVQEKERENRIAEGELVSANEVLALISGVMGAFVAELERAEADFALHHGREMAAAFRQSRKLAQSRASEALAAQAAKHLPPAIVALTTAVNIPEADSADEAAAA